MDLAGPGKYRKIIFARLVSSAPPFLAAMRRGIMRLDKNGFL
jgi:hypothetical protein